MAERFIPHRSRRLVEAAAGGLLLLGVVVLATSTTPFAALRERLDVLSGDGSADPYTRQLHQRVRLATVLTGAAIVASAISLWRMRTRAAQRLQRCAQEFTELGRWLQRHSRRVGWWLPGMTSVAILLRVPYLQQAMRFDEAYTFNNYASQPWFVALSRYEPNNHVFHSVLVWAVTQVGGDSPWAIRVPALAAGVLLVPATMLCGSIVGGRRVAILAGAVVAGSSPLIEYSANARGYTLVCLWATCGWLLLPQLVRKHNSAAWAGWGAVNVLGCWTIPIMIYPWAMQIAWLMWPRRRRPGQSSGGPRPQLVCAVTTLIGAAATLLAYLPVLLVAGPRTLVGNVHLASRSWRQMSDDAPVWLGDVVELLLRDLPWTVRWIMVAGGLTAVFVGPPGRFRLKGPLLCSAAVVVALVAGQRVLPFPRVWLFLLAPVATLVALGCLRWLRPLRGETVRRWAFATVLALLAIWPVATTIARQSVWNSRETGAFPEGPVLANDLQKLLLPNEPVVAVSPLSAPLIYYANQIGLNSRHFDRPDLSSPPESVVVVVSHRDGATMPSVLRQLNLEPLLPEAMPQSLREYPTATLYRLTAKSNEGR